MMRSLEHQGVTTIFGYPGGSIMPTFDALLITGMAPVMQQEL